MHENFTFFKRGTSVTCYLTSFVTFQNLAKKMTVLYKLAREQLSKQHHYDFGLRALKSVLVMAGELKRGSPDLNEVNNIGLCERRRDHVVLYIKLL